MDRKWLFIICILFVGVVFIILYQFNFPYNFGTFNFHYRPKPQPKYKRILFWTTIFGTYGKISTGRDGYSWCHVPNCESTTQKHEIDTVDAVIFHIRDIDLKNLPQNRTKNQKWIFLLQESPLHTGIELANIDNIFNWTMTYRLDSDIFMPYGIVDKRKPKDKTDRGLINYAEGKMRLAVWYVSNCITSGNREGYVKALQNYIHVDIFGKCGPYKCERNITDYCLKQAAKTYKFYLAFENSICKDYITEKFYLPLMHDIVPVVYGGGNYNAFAPPHSYINVADFQSPETLANYLRYLDRNNTAYNQYFEWKKFYTVNGESYNKIGWCALCAKLHSGENDFKTYPSINQWWYNGSVNTGSSQCVGGKTWV